LTIEEKPITKAAIGNRSQQKNRRPFNSKGKTKAKALAVWWRVQVCLNPECCGLLRNRNQFRNNLSPSA
jgi:hypothetical protein